MTWLVILGSINNRRDNWADDLLDDQADDRTDDRADNRAVKITIDLNEKKLHLFKRKKDGNDKKLRLFKKRVCDIFYFTKVKTLPM